MLCLVTGAGMAQRYDFQQYDIRHGLVQSQITSITQDINGRLWTTALGGLSMFDGKDFRNFTRTDGLVSNFAMAVKTDWKGNIYVGTSSGLSVYDGKDFHNSHKQAWISRLVTDGKGSIYTLYRKKLTRLSGTRPLPASGLPEGQITATCTGPSGNLWIAIAGKGLYELAQSRWKPPALNILINNLKVTRFLIDRIHHHRIWLVTPDGLYLVTDKKLSMQVPGPTRGISAIAQTAEGAIWLGTRNGAWRLNEHEAVHFTSRNGFTDNMVNDIFCDTDDNVWLGTDGAGLYKFNDPGYLIYDQTQGLGNQIVMALSEGHTPGSVWLGTSAGLYEYRPGKPVRSVHIPGTVPHTNPVNILLKDHKDNIWVGTPGDGLWKSDGYKINRIDRGWPQMAYNGIIEDMLGNIWLATDIGCLVFDPRSGKYRHISRNFDGALLEAGRDSVIFASSEGIDLITGMKKHNPLRIKALEGSGIMCMLKHNGKILFGTTDYGIVIWDKATGKTGTVNTKKGLSSDHVYSLMDDGTGTIWAGTGRGIDRLDAGSYQVRQDTRSPLLECNQNAILRENGKIWIGTTLGAVVYTGRQLPAKPTRPRIFIDSVTLSGKRIRDTISLSIPYSEQQLAISFTGVYLSGTEDLRYQYSLAGADDKFSVPSSGKTVSFTALPAGKYHFQVRALTGEGTYSATAGYTFEIAPPYYQTTPFRLLLLLLALLVIGASVYVIISLKERRRRLRLKIKLEEQFNIRKQTAEDFHDDLGNKLTRITVLSEVLTSMIGPEETEKRRILEKINTNIGELYSGTRDMLWSLNPKNDTLSQLLSHIAGFGDELFNDTTICFSSRISVTGNSRLSLSMSRNILMILKEAMHNALKHARPQMVLYTAGMSGDTLLITLQDDGQGFDTEKSRDGHGINNMRIRASRIGARLQISSGKNGTSLSLAIQFSTRSQQQNA